MGKLEIVKKSIIWLLMFVNISYCTAGSKVTHSATNGSWCNSSTWSNGIPDGSKDSIIITGYSVDATCEETLQIGSQGKLIIQNYGTLTVDNIEFSNGSTVIINPTCSLIVKNAINKNNSTNIIVYGTLIVNGTLDNGNGASISGSGKVFAYIYSGSCCIMGLAPSSIPNNSTIVDSVITGASTLPIELINFKVKCGNSNIDISWSTASETNNDYFTIEKSIDAQNWFIVGTVKGAGNSNIILNYSFPDNNSTNETTYYRLKQTDFDGNYKYSDNSVVNCKNNIQNNISIYPNPASNNIYIDTHADNIQVKIFDLSGNLIYEANSQKVIDLSNLPNGFYMLTVEDGNDVYRQKISIVK